MVNKNRLNHILCSCSYNHVHVCCCLNGPNPASFLFIFVLLSHCKDKYSTMTINDKSVDGVLESRTRGSRMESADESTELWKYPIMYMFDQSYICSTIVKLQCCQHHTQRTFPVSTYHTRVINYNHNMSIRLATGSIVQQDYFSRRNPESKEGQWKWNRLWSDHFRGHEFESSHEQFLLIANLNESNQWTSRTMRKPKYN